MQYLKINKECPLFKKWLTSCELNTKPNQSSMIWRRKEHPTCSAKHQGAQLKNWEILTVGKIAAGITRKELVMDELMGSTANEVFKRRITASWCGSRVAGWRIAVVKTSASLDEKASWFRWIRSGMCWCLE